jgi:hypothetical protein
MCLYAWMRRTDHDTEVGVLLGAITHLLDHVYDHRGLDAKQLHDIEDVVFMRRGPDPDDAFQTVLADLCTRAWAVVPGSEALRPCLERMLTTQRESLAQTERAALDPNTLHRLTLDKGHRSLCLYFSAANPGFSADEANALRSFGLYMQYMDDFEDMYEDRAEGRQSPISGVLHATREATAYLRPALRDLASFYRREPAYDWGIFAGWLVLFHLGILFSCMVREATRRLPDGLQRSLNRGQEAIGPIVPFIYAAPFEPDKPLQDVNATTTDAQTRPRGR